ASRRPDRLDGLEDGRVEHVHADQREIGRRILRFLHEPHDLTIAKLGDAELVRIRHGGQENLAIGLVLAEPCDQRCQPLANEIVAEVHAERLGAEKALRHEHRVRQTEGRFLFDVRDGDAEPAAVADSVLDLLAGVPDHDADLADPGGSKRFDTIEENRFVRDRNELLGRRERDGPEARATASGEDQSFHFSADYSSLDEVATEGFTPPSDREYGKIISLRQMPEGAADEDVEGDAVGGPAGHSRTESG